MRAGSGVNRGQATVVGLAKEYWKAIKDNDSHAVEELTDDTCLVVGPEGISELDRESLVEMMKAPPYELRSYDIDDKDMKVMSVGNNVAIVAYKVREELMMDGERSTLEALDSTVWVRRNAKWVW